MATALAKLSRSQKNEFRTETWRLWVYWRCDGMDDVSRVCDLSVGGLFLSTPVPPPVARKPSSSFLLRKDRSGRKLLSDTMFPAPDWV